MNGGFTLNAEPVASNIEVFDNPPTADAAAHGLFSLAVLLFVSPGNARQSVLFGTSFVHAVAKKKEDIRCANEVKFMIRFSFFKKLRKR
ncbi:MAG: hypothetical protein N3G22_02525 [Candidatus Micrarchaeota archaeon]|nr:hypothetical protein [Candidatus Micrarchaeota archaeon]